MSTNESRRDKPTATTDESDDNCPGCGGPIAGITTTGPSQHEVSPCGCSIGPQTALDLTGAGR